MTENTKPRPAATGAGQSGDDSEGRAASNPAYPWIQDGLNPAERLRFARDLTRLHRLGPRPIGELILEIVRRWPPARRAEFLERLACYAALDPTVVKKFGADRFPPQPLREMPR
jgi:hypothetical protein